MKPTIRILTACLMLEGAAAAGTITIQPSAAGDREEFEEVANRLEPGDELLLRGAALDGARFLDGGKASDAFAAVPGFDAALDPERSDLWPRRASPLIGAGDPRYAPAEDFNGDPRAGPPDAGAYQTAGLERNPGWKIRAGFKNPGARSGVEGRKTR